MTPNTIKRLRKRFGWTQPDLAGRIGVTAQTVWNWEHGTTLPPTAASLLRRVFDDETAARSAEA